MSSRSLRRVLAGSLVTAFLALSGPISAEAADLFESSEAASLWVQACQWLMAQISPVDEKPAAVSSETTAEEDDSDAGWTLDPNG